MSWVVMVGARDLKFMAVSMFWPRKARWKKGYIKNLLLRITGGK